MMADGFLCLFILSPMCVINSLGVEACCNSLMTAQYHTAGSKQILLKVLKWLNTMPPEIL